MPYRLTENNSKIQFVTSAKMPNQIYRACLKTGIVSNTVYIRNAVAEALSRDLGIPLQEIMDELPPPRSRAMSLFDGTRIIKKHRIGPHNTVEEVK